ncbi:MAG: helix-turn-helix domain-containing protein [Clostridia bacterium]|nr:helix-turn-helix domain-containing protein [Clostridia bacterium]
MKPMSYTADVQTLHSGTIAFENVPGNIYRAIIDLLGGRGVIETREPSRPETVDVQPTRLVHVLTLGQTLRKLRSRANLAPQQVAAWCGVTPTTVYRWESDRRKPTRPNRERLCSLYGIPSIPVLFGEEETK